jgi:UDP:flavonoid glycosyltransferase YjiC (YdhE family)
VAVVFYISGHGFGHASRSIEVINALVDRRPDLGVVVRSQVAPWLFELTARPTVQLEPVETDTGVAQIDSLHLDERETLSRARAFMNTLPDRIKHETSRLRALGATLVIADLPPLGIAAAKAAGIPGVAFGNFTWDWIYSGYEAGPDLAESIGDIYRDTTLALRLPMWGGFATMPVVRDLPFVARRSSRDPAEVRRAFGFTADERLVLVSFGGYGLRIDPLVLTRVPGYRVLAPGTFDEQNVYGKGYRYEDLVRAVDVVVSKPGYGILSECLANDTALLYTSRGHFLEYDVLVAAMPRVLRCAFIDHDDLFAGRWQTHLDALLAQPAPSESPATNGADVATTALLEMI